MTLRVSVGLPISIVRGSRQRATASRVLYAKLFVLTSI